MGRAPCCDKGSVKRGPWSPQEDATLTSYIHKHGTGGNWIALPRKAGLNRCGKSCRLRWLNYLRPDIKHGAFTHDEDNLIFTLYSTIGSRWAVIASQLPGRTDNDVKNHWNTKLKKKFNSFSKTPNDPTLLAAASQHNDAIPPPFSAAANSLILDEHNSKSTNFMFSGPCDFKQSNLEAHHFGPQDPLFPMSNPAPELLSTSSSFSSLPIVEQNHHLPLSRDGGGSDDAKLLLDYGPYDYQYPYEDVIEGFDAINYGIMNYLPEV